jgi:hypothetical protein
MEHKELTLRTFEDIVRLCKQHIGKKFKMSRKNPNYAQILGVLSAILESFSHFEILGNDKEQILSIEFHIESGKDSDALQKSIKYWKGVKVFDLAIQYDPNWKKGRIYISCEYSYGIEKICAYICEFIYQVKSRIENITEVLK